MIGFIEDGLIGFKSMSGEVLFPPSFSGIVNEYGEKLVVYKKEGETLYGVIDTHGRVIVPVEYLSASYQPCGYTIVSTNELNSSQIKQKYGLYNPEGKLIIPCEFDDLEIGNLPADGDFIVAFKEGEKWGYLNNMGEVVLEPTLYYRDYSTLRYDPSFGDFMHLVTRVPALNGTGILVIGPTKVFNWRTGQMLSDEEAVEHLKRYESEFINRRQVKKSDNGYRIVEKGGLKGLESPDGNVVVEYYYNSLRLLDPERVDWYGRVLNLDKWKNVFIFSKDGKHYGLLSPDGIICEDKYSTIDDPDNYALALKRGRYGLLDSDGTEVLRCKYKSIESVCDGYALVDQDKLISFDGNVVVTYPHNDYLERHIETVIDGKVYIVEEDNSSREMACGLVRSDGVTVIPLYDRCRSIRYVGRGCFCFETKNCKHGLINSEGVEIIAARYQSLDMLDCGIIKGIPEPAKKDLRRTAFSAATVAKPDDFYDWQFNKVKDKKSTSSKTKKTKTSKNESCMVPDESRSYLVPFVSGTLFGYLDSRNQAVAIPAIYDWAKPFEGDYACVMKDGKFGCIRRSGELVLPIEYDAPIYFNTYGFAKIKKGIKYGLCGPNAEIILQPKYLNVGDRVSLGYVRVLNDGKWFYVDVDGNKKSPRVYNDATDFNDKGSAFVYIEDRGKYGDSKWYAIDADFNDYSGCVYRGDVLIKKGRKVGAELDDKSLTTHPVSLPDDSNMWMKDRFLFGGYSPAPKFKEGFAAVNSDNSYRYGTQGPRYFINELGIKFTDIYDKVHDFSEGLAAVCISDKWGFIDGSGQTVIPCLYHDVGSFENGMCSVWDEGWSFIGKDGNYLCDCKFISIKSSGRGKFIVESDTGFGVVGMVDGKFSTLVECTHKQLEWVPDLGMDVLSEQKDGSVLFFTVTGRIIIKENISSYTNPSDDGHPAGYVNVIKDGVSHKMDAFGNLSV